MTTKKKAQGEPKDKAGAGRSTVTLEEAELFIEALYIYGVRATIAGLQALEEGKTPEEAVAASRPLVEEGSELRAATWASRRLLGLPQTFTPPLQSKGGH
ncbi:MAG TPA: hypothetical protein VE713_01840 [Pyrinomonadaceae bacterium]|jgi:hypothetical protein|nr:hypothetical protein [Pyrinomonadaceae bacterium]